MEMNIVKNELDEVSSTIKETTQEYYTDMYSAGEVKERLVIGNEVQPINEVSGTIDTSDTTLTKVDNVFRLSVADPTGKIFSMTFNGQSKTFQNTSGYTELETALQTWLGDAYIVEYDTGTYFNISRVDGQEVLYQNPNLVRNIALSNTPDDWNVHSKIDIIIDGVTYQLLGTTYGDSTSALNYLVSALTGVTYFVKREGTSLVIARQDGAIPTISKTQYNRYIHELQYEYDDTVSSGQFWNNTTTTIDGISNVITGTGGRPFRGDWIIRNIIGNYSYQQSLGLTGGGTLTDNATYGIAFTPDKNSVLDKVTKLGSVTATRALLQNSSGTTITTASFSGNEATFNYTLTAGVTYRIVADNSGANYTAYRTFTIPSLADGFGTSGGIATYAGNLDSFHITPVSNYSSYTTSALYRNSGSGDSYWIKANEAQYFNKQHSFYIRKSDYSSITASSVTTYTGRFPNDVGLGYSFTQTNQLADITVTTYTEITKTFTLLSNNFYIRTNNYPQYIKITAVSSGGTSEGEYKNRGQNTTARYGTTTENVQDLIFKTDASNYGNIVLIKRGGFVITWTTNTSNILTYTCK